MNRPPAKLDGAEVLWWAWSGEAPFGLIHYGCEPSKECVSDASSNDGVCVAGRGHLTALAGPTVRLDPAQTDLATIARATPDGDRGLDRGSLEAEPLPPIEIYGLAICAYDSSTIYRFSCDRNWEVRNDAPCDSVESAQQSIPEQFKNEPVVWVKYSPTESD